MSQPTVTATATPRQQCEQCNRRPGIATSLISLPPAHVLTAHGRPASRLVEQSSCRYRWEIDARRTALGQRRSSRASPSSPPAGSQQCIQVEPASGRLTADLGRPGSPVCSPVECADDGRWDRAWHPSECSWRALGYESSQSSVHECPEHEHAFSVTLVTIATTTELEPGAVVIKLECRHRSSIASKCKCIIEQQCSAAATERQQSTRHGCCCRQCHGWKQSGGCCTADAGHAGSVKENCAS